MKKAIKYASLLLALVCGVACDKNEIVEAVPENSKVQALTVEATLPAASGEGMRTAFLEKDNVVIRFASAEGQFIGAPQILACESADGKTAVFSSDKVAVREDAANAVIYLDNKDVNKVNFASQLAWNHIGGQNGTFDDAVAHQVVLATVPAAELASGKVAAALQYKTGIMKLKVKFPEDASLVDADGTVIVPTFTITSKTQFNDIQLDLDNPSDKSSKGDITVPASKVDADAKTAEAYIALWPQANDFNESSLIARIGTTVYGTELVGLKLDAGKTTPLDKNVEIRVFNVWRDDNASMIENILGNVVESVSWITKEGKNIVIAENTSGNMRTGSIVLDNGITYTITQLGPNMFKGMWTLKSRRFNPNGTAPGFKGTTAAHEQDVTLGEARQAIKVKDGSLEYTTNVGITGLYGTAVLDAVAAIDYEARTIKFALVFDRRKPQICGDAWYGVILPELAASNFAWSGYNFAPGSKVFSDDDIQVLWLKVSDDFKSLKYNFRSPNGQLTHNGKYSICGISCVRAKSEDVASIGTGYDVIYQANYNTQDAGGLEFVR